MRHGGGATCKDALRDHLACPWPERRGRLSSEVWHVTSETRATVTHVAAHGPSRVQLQDRDGRPRSPDKGVKRKFAARLFFSKEHQTFKCCESNALVRKRLV